jgi:hypothetical protein
VIQFIPHQANAEYAQYKWHITPLDCALFGLAPVVFSAPALSKERMLAMTTQPRNDDNGIGAATDASASAAGEKPGLLSRLPRFSNKETIVLLIAVAVFIAGTAAAAFSPDRSTASTAPSAAPVAVVAPRACLTTASVASTTPPSATLVSVAVAQTPSAVATATGVASTTVARVTSTIKKSTTIKKSAAPKAAAPAAPSLVSVGTLINFGSYDGKTLRWRVLDADASGVLLLSEYIVSAGAFQSDWEGRSASTYGTSEVRTWLKSGFSAKAFDTTETAALLPHSGGAAGSDRVFLLSASEVNRYLPKAANRRAAPGSSAGGGQVGFSGQALGLAGPYASWWLADGANDNYTAQLVGADGKLGSQLVYYADIGVRPAIRINREKISFSLDANGGN